MKYLVLVLVLAVGCVSSTDRQTIAFQAARLDRAVALINSGSVTEKEKDDFIRAERKVWHSLNYSINGKPLPRDMQSVDD